MKGEVVEEFDLKVAVPRHQVAVPQRRRDPLRRAPGQLPAFADAEGRLEAEDLERAISEEGKVMV